MLLRRQHVHHADGTRRAIIVRAVVLVVAHVKRRRAAGLRAAGGYRIPRELRPVGSSQPFPQTPGMSYRRPTLATAAPPLPATAVAERPPNRPPRAVATAAPPPAFTATAVRPPRP
jgi:hypothetical protein